MIESHVGLKNNKVHRFLAKLPGEIMLESRLFSVTAEIMLLKLKRKYSVLFGFTCRLLKIIHEKAMQNSTVDKQIQRV